MSNTLKLGNGKWATGKDTVLSFSDTNNNYKPLSFSFNRNSSATVVNKDGLIETVGSGEPRIDFKDNTKGALLLEPSRTNKISTSNDFNGSGWLITDITATANQSVSPDGTLNASKLEMTGNGSLRNQSQASFNDGYAYSIFVKKGNSRYVTIRSAFFTQSFNCGFDLDTLTAETNGKIEDYGNDWYRLSIIKNISGDADRSGFFYLYLPNSLGSQTSVSGNYAYFYGGQIEEGSYATSYIPTSGSAITRVAESSSQTVPDGVIGQTEGTMYAQLGNIPSQAIDDVFVELSDGTSNNRILFYADSNGYIRNQIKASGSISSLINTNVTVSSNMKIAITYKSNEAKVFINGVQYGGTDTSVVVPSVNKMNLENYTGTRSETSTLKDVKLYNTSLTDQELIALTQ